MIGDKEIRSVVHGVLRDELLWYRDEVRVGRGGAVIDILSVSATSLDGYEIKSEKDSLKRLLIQQTVYETTFDRITLVCAPKHLQAAEKQVPPHWGLVIAWERCDGSVAWDSIRAATNNPNVHAQGLFSLLRAKELLAELERRGIDRGARGSRWKMQERYLSDSTILDLKRFVRITLATRQWELAPPGA